jgi:hypothetical protein
LKKVAKLSPAFSGDTFNETCLLPELLILLVRRRESAFDLLLVVFRFCDLMYHLILCDFKSPFNLLQMGAL